MRLSRVPEQSADRWRAVFDAADRVLELPLEERPAFLERYARDHPDLADEVRALLADAEAPSPLDDRAAAFASPMLDLAVREQDSEPPRSRFGPYSLLREIGRGGMGAVYLAERSDDQYHKRVALKLLPVWSAGDQRLVQRFFDERQILAALDHPDIARLVDGGVTPEGLPWFALEFVDGVPIDRYCDERSLSIADRLTLFCQICGAVQYAHRNLVVHCDLKPANILVTAEGRVRLLDFGIARLLGGPATSGRSADGDQILTPLYASPEQIRGEAVTTASDVYALGVLLNVLLVGRSPYRLASGERHEITRAALEHDVMPPSAAIPDAADSQHEETAASRGTDARRLRRRLEGDLDAIVLKALEKEPSRRYATAQQLESDVRRHLDDLPITAHPGRRLHDARKYVRRHRVGVGMGATLAGLVLAFAITMTVLAVRISAQAERIAVERDRAEQVSHFLRRTLATSDPGPVVQRRGITGRELLDSTVARIDGAIFADSAERARLTFEMALAYQRLGFADRARVLLERSLAMRRALRPPRDLEVAETSHLLGDVLLQQREPALAEHAYTDALTLRRRALGSNDGAVARTLVGLATALRARHRLPEAERLASEAMAIDRNRPADLARSTGALAAVRLDAGDHREATRLFERALALARSAHPEEHVDVASAVFGLAAALHSAGDRATADSLIGYALALHQRLVLTVAPPAGAGVALPAIPSADVAVPAATAPASAIRRDDSAGRSARWSAVEDSILFVSDRAPPNAGDDRRAAQLYVMAADGSGQRRVSDEIDAASYAAWSPDGTEIAFSSLSAGDANIVVVAADGTRRRRLIDPSMYGAGAIRPDWSPDGRRIAFQSLLRSDIYVIGIDGTRLVNITDHPGRDLNPAWSPDGRRIMFTSDRDGSDEIYLMDPDGRHIVRLTFNEHEERRPRWSPDGRRIAFLSTRDGHRELYVMNADGSDQLRLTSGTGDVGAPSWSPDGRRIVFHRHVLSRAQLYVMNADGSDLRRLTEPSGAAFSAYPSWRPRR